MVEITLTANISSDSIKGIYLTDDDKFTDDFSTSLYMALTDGDRVADIDDEYGISIHVTLEGSSEEGDEYPSYSFWLTGIENRNEDWRN